MGEKFRSREARRSARRTSVLFVEVRLPIFVRVVGIACHGAAAATDAEVGVIDVRVRVGRARTKPGEVHVSRRSFMMEMIMRRLRRQRPLILPAMPTRMTVGVSENGATAV